MSLGSYYTPSPRKFDGHHGSHSESRETVSPCDTLGYVSKSILYINYTLLPGSTTRCASRFKKESLAPFGKGTKCIMVVVREDNQQQMAPI